MPSCFPVSIPFRRLLTAIQQAFTLSVCSLLMVWAFATVQVTSAEATTMTALLAQTNARSQLARVSTERDEAVEDEEISLMPPDIQAILDRGKLVVAVLGSSNAPFFMDMDQGIPGGIDIQLAQAIAEQLGVDLELNRSADTFNDVVETVYNREADMAISKISRTMKRAIRVRFTQPYLTMRQGLLINRLLLAQQTNSDNVRVIETIRELTGEVGVIKGSSYVGFLKQKFPKATIVEMEAWEDIVAAVSAGEILAGYRDELEIKKVIKTRPDAALQLKTALLTDTQDALSMVLPWDSPHLLAFANQYLETLDQELTVDGILEEYSSYLLPEQAAS